MSEKHWREVVGKKRLYNTAFTNRDVVLWDVLPVENEEKLQLTFESKNSEWEQGVWLASSSSLSSACRDLNRRGDGHLPHGVCSTQYAIRNTQHAILAKHYPHGDHPGSNPWLLLDKSTEMEYHLPILQRHQEVKWIRHNSCYKN